jgi:MFS family permease
MYLAPVTTVMKWFPDRRGLATGIALSAFGTGAAIAPGIIQRLIDFYAVAPDYIGPLAELTHGLSPDDCVTLATLADGTQVVAENSAVGIPGEPVVVATEADIARLSPAVSSSSSSSAAASGSHSPGA